MSIQLVILHIILFTFLFLFLFLLLVHFEYGIGQIVKDIENLHDRINHNTNNTYFTNIINITESDYEDPWNIRADYWFHNWENQNL